MLPTLFAGWMYSVCHVVILVQDWFLDMNLMRLLQAAETLKPVTPTGFYLFSSQYLSL
jgi:protein SMG9